MRGPMQALPGFRDFYPADCAVRHHLTATWRRVARSFGFVEYDGPALEDLDLYAKKNSGGEILRQLFDFTDKGGRRVALRPEMTPTLARMVVARERDFRKPMKWFSIAPFYRYEKQQKGRLREFLQFNADLLGDASAGADAEMVALLIETLRSFGLGPSDVVVRVSDRRAWVDFLAAQGLSDPAALQEALQVVDKIGRQSEEVTRERLAACGLRLEAVQEFIHGAPPEFFRHLEDTLTAMGLGGWCQADLGIVRGLAYYTGLVFEVFDRAGALRAVAGGGRYDRLLEDLSGGKVCLPAVGFGMGDVVLGQLLEAIPSASTALQQEARKHLGCEIQVVVADEARRTEALGVVATLRAAGRRVDYALSPGKVGRQFQQAEAAGAVYAVVVGAEWPQIRVKDLRRREETVVSEEALAPWARLIQTDPP